jgi:hypothetical protein
MDGRARVLPWTLAIAFLGNQACGGRAPAEPDGGEGDADMEWPEGCSLMGYREGPLITTDDVRECVVCVESHARLANPLRLSASTALSAVAVPGGLIITDYYFGAFATFLTVDGDHVVLPELPHDDEPFEDRYEDDDSRRHVQAYHDQLGIEWSPGLYGWGNGIGWAHPVHGTNRVWIGSRVTARDQLYYNREDMVLYEYGVEGWRRLASGHRLGRAYFRRTALDTGELVGVLLDGRLLRVRPLEDGTVDMLYRSLPDDLGIPEDDRSQGMGLFGLWPLPTGDVAVRVSERIRLGPEFHTNREWLGVLDSDLQPVLPWQLLGPEVDNPLYVAGEVPYSRVPWRIHVTPDRRAFALLLGTLAGTGAASWQHRWGIWISDEGEIEQEPPGIFLNPDHYVMAGDANWQYYSGAVHGLPGARAAVIWDDNQAAGLVGGHTWGQVLEANGSTAFEEPQALGPSRDERNLWIAWSQDGSGHAYLHSLWFETGELFPEDPRYDDRRMGVQRVGPDLQYEWAESTTVQTCPEYVTDLGTNDYLARGAFEDGLWFTWGDTVRTHAGSTGFVRKVTLIRPDGTFAWTTE